MRPDHALPVRPAVLDGEALSGYANRLADANGLHPAALVPRGYVDSTAPAAVVARFAAASGLTTAQVQSMTLALLPPSVRGRGAWLRHGWRLHQDVTWVCPICTDQTGYRALLWRLALMPVCTRCRVLLVQDHDIPYARPAPPELLDLAGVLSTLLTQTLTDVRARRVLSRLRNKCRDLALTVDPRDPPVVGLPGIDVEAARGWGPHPTPDPATMATVLLAAGNRLVPRSPSRLPQRTNRFAGSERERLDWFLSHVRRAVSRDGLRTDHVPTTLPAVRDGQTQPRRPGQWLSLTRAAAALHMLIARAQGQDDTLDAALRSLRVPDLPSCLLIDAIGTGRGLRQYDAELLGAALEVLLADGLTDYRRRRDTLRAVTRLPAATTRHLHTQLPDTAGHPGRRLALGWIWTTFTHGPMRSSRWPTIPDRDVHAFAARIDPQTRLLLHDTGLQLLATADLQPTTADTAALLLTGTSRATDSTTGKEDLG